MLQKDLFLNSAQIIFSHHSVAAAWTHPSPWSIITNHFTGNDKWLLKIKYDDTYSEEFTWWCTFQKIDIKFFEK